MLKEFSCGCGSKEFILFQRKETLVDYGKEGAIEGHPFIASLDLRATSIECYSCGKAVTNNILFQEMLREVI